MNARPNTKITWLASFTFVISGAVLEEKKHYFILNKIWHKINVFSINQIKQASDIGVILMDYAK